ncbi:hypothetical protein XELAEV_18007294mg [Xenopus laevis]|uniref:Ig-like domain-containing protein n=1 Tax=Xenopus laevis TaxID=8355 RepID=A0A974E0W4_XENLA|nr:hypothetical protein XELAEV_18007294mg [Xenopus laevis]
MGFCIVDHIPVLSLIFILGITKQTEAYPVQLLYTLVPAKPQNLQTRAKTLAFHMSTFHTPHSSSGKENEAKTITCTYITSITYPCLYWYRQYPNGYMQCILRKSTYCSGRAEGYERFEAVTDSSSTSLTISSLKPTDTAVYYCAIADIHTYNIYCRL